MGVIAFNPMLKAVTTKARFGRHHGGWHVGILIPPSVMIIVYAARRRAVGGQALRRGDVPGFFLSFRICLHHRAGR